MLQKEIFKLEGAEGKTISGDYTFENSTPVKATIIFVHGFKGFKDWGAHNLAANFFAKAGFRYLKFNLSHSGVTDNKPNDVTDMDVFASNTVSKELSDVDTVINYTSSKFPDSPIYLIGHSRGGGLVIITAANDDRIEKLATWSSIADFSSLWKKNQEEQWVADGKIYVENARTKEKMPLNSTLLTDYQTHKKELNILKAASRVKMPWLILHGDDDVNVDFSVGQQLAQQQLKAKIQKIEGANHVYGASHPYNSNELPPHLQQVLEKTLSFFN
ncbi:MAG: alpha/beta fold hydrolase [Pedobacter sp.]|nr:MAG: alpha/beta fold hydrolase [Pedobacter sp.]